MCITALPFNLCVFPSKLNHIFVFLPFKALHFMLEFSKWNYYKRFSRKMRRNFFIKIKILILPGINLISFIQINNSKNQWINLNNSINLRQPNKILRTFKNFLKTLKFMPFSKFDPTLVAQLFTKRGKSFTRLLSHLPRNSKLNFNKQLSDYVKLTHFPKFSNEKVFFFSENHFESCVTLMGNHYPFSTFFETW
jgi:hypothetical protein